ncbi:MAG TPA: aspartate/glutamate racemase family protein [Clostridiaceae bacterium]|nr:aspartate/glutamate racemase family protein [Clostridiaceae bacterium]
MKLGIVSVTLNAVNPLVQFLHSEHGEIEYLNYLDSGLIERVNRDKSISDTSMERMKTLIRNAKSDGVDGVLLTCTVFSPYVEDFSAEIGIPVIAADRAMIELALDSGRKTAILYTFPSTRTSTLSLIQNVETSRGEKLDHELVFVENAFEALQKGSHDLHDRLIADKVSTLHESFGLIVLAQISMIGATKLIERDTPVLTSPSSALSALRIRLKAKE